MLMDMVLGNGSMRFKYPQTSEAMNLKTISTDYKITTFLTNIIKYDQL